MPRRRRLRNRRNSCCRQMNCLRFLHRYSFEIAVTVLAGPFVFAALGLYNARLGGALQRKRV